MQNENNPGGVSAGVAGNAVGSQDQPTRISDDDLRVAKPIKLIVNSLPVVHVQGRGDWYGHPYFVVKCPCHGEVQAFEPPRGTKPRTDANGARDQAAYPGPFRVQCEVDGRPFRVEEARP